MDTMFGKIHTATFIDTDGRLGFLFDLKGTGWGCGDFWGFWSTDHTPSCEWTPETRHIALGEACMRVQKLFVDARKRSLDQLVGMPVEATFEGNLLRSWRILSEVL